MSIGLASTVDESYDGHMSREVLIFADGEAITDQ
jgi:hypothetical protein